MNWLPLALATAVAFAVYLKLAGRELAVSGAGLVFAALALATPVIMGGSVLVAALVGILLLGERVGHPQVAGILLVAGGIALLSTGRSH